MTGGAGPSLGGADGAYRGGFDGFFHDDSYGAHVRDQLYPDPFRKPFRDDHRRDLRPDPLAWLPDGFLDWYRTRQHPARTLGDFYRAIFQYVREDYIAKRDDALNRIRDPAARYEPAPWEPGYRGSGRPDLDRIIRETYRHDPRRADYLWRTVNEPRWYRKAVTDLEKVMDEVRGNMEKVAREPFG